MTEVAGKIHYRTPKVAREREVTGHPYPYSRFWPYIAVSGAVNLFQRDKAFFCHFSPSENFESHFPSIMK
ncbi:hypothetical protein L1N85_14735 [Paenibacillus alkaliterrae]|uniref:hypothetical protein n=1 Tax=Paenibacillus alkaliterrae TaxID=320909 RepID=UPI001F345D9B|nr:hypothetical protein [Paenibacillus alkaliterrae]MCF2939676.1 hypothetical protein [Paenibacillus alkaliterrae]